MKARTAQVLVAVALVVPPAGCSGVILGGGDGAGPGGGAGGAAGSLDAGALEQPPPRSGAGLSDPLTRSLHDHGCGGVDWQRIHGWLLLPHKPPEIAPADLMHRCVERYAGWVTNLADAAGVSRSSVYADLAATGQCDADRGYDGALVPGALCVKVHPELDADSCLAHMADSPGFGIGTVAKALGQDAAVKRHKRDVPLMAAYLGQGAVACGGTDRWKLVAPDGFIDRYVRAYNGVKALASQPPSCAKRLVVTVALYTGMDDPGQDGVAAANGCWTYERVSKASSEWKLCGYDGSVHHPDGVKWAYDDTNTAHDSTTERSRILACQDGVPGRGYIDMANRGSGWPKVIKSGVRAHFAELYSGQYQVDDQFSLWKSAGKPGQPMLNFGEASTGASRIHDATLRACKEVADGGFVGVYIYPEPLRGGRLGALVRAMNACTGG